VRPEGFRIPNSSHPPSGNAPFELPPLATPLGKLSLRATERSLPSHFECSLGDSSGGHWSSAPLRSAETCSYMGKTAPSPYGTPPAYTKNACHLVDGMRDKNRLWSVRCTGERPHHSSPEICILESMQPVSSRAHPRYSRPVSISPPRSQPPSAANTLSRHITSEAMAGEA